MLDPDLVNAVRNRTAMLFVGAGVSRTLGLPAFGELISEMGLELGYESDIFSSYGEPWTLVEYYRHERGTLGELRSRLDAEWHSNVDIGDSVVHRHLVRLEVPLIYTTNWDRWLELAFAHYGVDHQVVRHVGDLEAANSASTQIVKFHGDFSNDDSLVLTETSYFERMRFESPLDIRLRSDSLGRTILFLGYSLRDLNMRFLLYRLSQIWSESPYAKAQPKSFLVTDRPNPVQDSVLDHWGVRSIEADEGDSEGERLESFLHCLRLEAFGVTD